MMSSRCQGCCERSHLWCTELSFRRNASHWSGVLLQFVVKLGTRFLPAGCLNWSCRQDGLRSTSAYQEMGHVLTSVMDDIIHFYVYYDIKVRARYWYHRFMCIMTSKYEHLSDVIDLCILNVKGMSTYEHTSDVIDLCILNIKVWGHEWCHRFTHNVSSCDTKKEDVLWISCLAVMCRNFFSLFYSILDHKLNSCWWSEAFDKIVV